MQSRGKKTLWVTDTCTLAHSERAEELGAVGFNITFVNGPGDFKRALEAGRPGTIIVDSHTVPDDTQRVITMIATTPELAAARCVLNLTKSDLAASKLAMAANFRDLIPWRIDSASWLTRLQYAVAPRAVTLSAPICSVTMNHPAVLRVPGRLIWMNETHLKIECRGQFKPGTTLHVAGPVAAALGSHHMSLIVESVHHDRLLYRYSQAIVAKWGVPADRTDRAQALMRKLKNENPGPRVRVFIAMHRVAWRKLTVAMLSPAEHELNVAMQRGNLSSEFAYFSPDIVLFDDGVVSHLKDDELVTMFSKLGIDIPLLVFGKEFDPARLSRLLPGRRLIVESELNMVTLSNIAKKHQVAPHNLDDGGSPDTIHFMADHMWSHVELEVSARIRSLSPKGGTIGLPFSLGNFTLARVEAPIIKKALGRDVYLKITSVKEATSDLERPQFNHDSDFRLTDVDQDDYRKIATVLSMTVAEYFTKHFRMLPLAPLRESPVKPPAVQAAEQRKLQSLVIPLPEIQDATPVSDEELEISMSPRSLEPRRLPTKRGFSLDLDFGISRHIDPILAKALALFLVAAGLMGLVIYSATHVDEKSYKDHGKQYGEFFKRMKDPEYRKANPAPGWDRVNKYNERIKGEASKADPSDSEPTH